MNNTRSSEPENKCCLHRRQRGGQHASRERPPKVHLAMLSDSTISREFVQAAQLRKASRGASCGTWAADARRSRRGSATRAGRRRRRRSRRQRRAPLPCDPHLEEQQLPEDRVAEVEHEREGLRVLLHAPPLPCWHRGQVRVERRDPRGRPEKHRRARPVQRAVQRRPELVRQHDQDAAVLERLQKPVRLRGVAYVATNFVHHLTNFRKLVCGCMDSYDSEPSHILQHFSSSTVAPIGRKKVQALFFSRKKIHLAESCG